MLSVNWLFSLFLLGRMSFLLSQLIGCAKWNTQFILLSSFSPELFLTLLEMALCGISVPEELFCQSSLRSLPRMFLPPLLMNTLVIWNCFCWLMLWPFSGCPLNSSPSLVSCLFDSHSSEFYSNNNSYLPRNVTKQNNLWVYLYISYIMITIFM